MVDTDPAEPSSPRAARASGLLEASQSAARSESAYTPDVEARTARFPWSTFAAGGPVQPGPTYEEAP